MGKTKKSPAIDYAFDQVPDAGQTMGIDAGIQWLRMPLPFALGHINLWLIEDGSGWASVDTGLNGETSIDVWESLFDGYPLTRILVTHMHPDHVGMAGWLTERLGLELWMPREEYLMCRVLSSDQPPAPQNAIEFYRAAGFSEEALAQYERRFGMFGRFVSPPPKGFRRLRDGDAIAIGRHDWEVIIGRGHSPEHACLYCAELNVLISGDQILPTISSNISLWPTEPDADPLADWLASCRNLRERFPADVLVLPAHGKPFRGAYRRLDEPIAEHEDALDKLAVLCAEPKSAIEVFPALFKSKISDGNLMMATGESLAHLHYLVKRGVLAVETDADRVQRYHAT